MHLIYAFNMHIKSMFGYKLNSIFIRSMYLIYAFACRYVWGGQRSKKTLDNGWPPSSQLHLYTQRLERHIKIKLSFISSSFLNSLHFCMHHTKMCRM